MKVTLEFNLPEEGEDHIIAINGWRWRSVVSVMLNRLKQKIKYDDVEMINVEEVRQMIFKIIEEEELFFD